MSGKLSSDAASLSKALKELNEAISGGSQEKAVEMMERLKADITPTEELLRTTKAGSILAGHRKNPDTTISDMAKDVVKVWKDIIEGQRKRKRDADEAAGKVVPPKKVKTELTSTPDSPAISTPPTTRDIKPLSKSKKSNSSTQEDVKQEVKAEELKEINPPKEVGVAPGSRASGSPVGDMKFETIDVDRKTPRSAKGDKMTDIRAESEGSHSDPVRDKCVVMIYDALASDSTASNGILAERAVSLERSVYQLFEYNTNNDYRAKIRSLFLNLKDKGNPGLRDKIVLGVLDAEAVVNMSKEDMASASVKAMNEKLAKDNLFKAKNVTEVQAETNAFKCGKCHQRRCSFYQMQTRSADEPMTTFATCLNCNHKWKFC